MSVGPTNIPNQAPEEVDYDNTFSNPDASDFPSSEKYADTDVSDINEDEYEEFDNSILNPLTGDFNNNADVGTSDNPSE